MNVQGDPRSVTASDFPAKIADVPTRRKLRLFKTALPRLKLVDHFGSDVNVMTYLLVVLRSRAITRGCTIQLSLAGDNY